MVYKKYIKKNGKTYGPYIYHSKRVDGKVISEYRGLNEKKQSPQKFLFISAIIVILIVSAIFLNLNLTGNVTLDLNERINENLEISMSKGELIPLNSKIKIYSEDEDKEYLLSDLINQEILIGEYYFQGENLKGTGEGIGVIGEKQEYPIVYFKFKIINASETTSNSGSGSDSETDSETDTGTDPITTPLDNNQTSSENQSETKEETSIKSSENQSETKEETPTSEQEPIEESPTKDLTTETSEPSTPENSESEETEQEQIEQSSEITKTSETDSTTETTEQISSENPEESPEENSQSEEEASESEETDSSQQESPKQTTSGLTGAITGFITKLNPTANVISESTNKEIIQGDIQSGKEFTYDLKQGQKIEIISGSIRTEEKELDKSALNIEIIDNKLTITTDYKESEQGFGKDYLGEEIIIPLKKEKINTTKDKINKIELLIEDQDSSQDFKTPDNETSENNTSEQNKTQETPELNKTETLENTTNITLENQTQELNLTSKLNQSKNILENFLGTSNITTTLSEYRNKIILEMSIKDYQREFSYSQDLTEQELNQKIKEDKNNFIIDLANKFTEEKFKKNKI